jgi:hypothetical protein
MATPSARWTLPSDQNYSDPNFFSEPKGFGHPRQRRPNAPAGGAAERSIVFIVRFAHGEIILPKEDPRVGGDWRGGQVVCSE